MHTSPRRRALDTALGIIFLAIMLFPLYWMINTSLQSGGTAASSSWFPTQPTLDGYRLALSQQTKNLVTSIIVSIGTVVVTLVVATPAAYALARFRLRGMGVLTFFLLVAQMIPGIVIANSLYTLYNNAGLLNSYGGLILADATHAIPFAILILGAFMRTIPDAIIEAARVDGAGRLRVFFAIAVPVSRNSIITAGLFSFLFAWSDFVFAVTLTTGAEIRPVTLGIYGYLQGDVQSWGPVMATAVLSSIPAVALLVFAQRYIAAGALGGAVK